MGPTDQGFRVMRFWNNEVLSNTDAVLNRILSAARLARMPLSRKGEGKNHELGSKTEAHDSDSTGL
ncbi:DUF559 domain-containing protein [Afipia sp. TerB]